jgi:NAD(P)-dependent dehydrogenase (short-subunit alcohol dehydrogenase family)
MSSARKLVDGAAAMLGMQVARSLYGRWRRMTAADRERLEPLAEDLKRQALDLRGRSDTEHAEADLRQANERLAAGIIETAEADPELGEVEVRALRADLRQELDRLASADIEASRGADVRQDSA